MVDFVPMAAQSKAPGLKRIPAAELARPKLPFTETQASLLLDLLRGLAAVVVVLEHWRNLLFVDYGQIASHRLLYAPMYVLTSAGHQAVLVFFVLSGYLISGSIFRMVARGGWSWKVYLTHRLVRLWVVLVPGLLLCAICDNTGRWLGFAPGLYGGHSGNHLVGDVALRLAPWIFAGNVLFLQGIRVPEFGSDGALWSLAYEFWFYVLFPLGYFTAVGNTALKTRLICIAGLVLTGVVVGRGVLLSFPFWLLGALLACVRPPSLRAKSRWIAGSMYVPLFFYCSKATMGAYRCDTLLAVATTALIWVLLSAKERSAKTTATKATRLLARCSFTLYVVHLPVCLLLTAVLLGDHRLQPGVGAIPVAAGMLLMVAGTAYGMARATEFHTDEVRHWTERRLGLLRRVSWWQRRSPL